MRARLRRVEAALTETKTRPRVFVCEWLDPPFAAGHWVPDMVAVAGGEDVAAEPGEPSRRLSWSDVAALDPDVIVLAPCGFDLDRTLAETDPDTLRRELGETSARREGMVFAVDANAYFSRPGPRLVDGVELLAHLLHPGAYSDPGLPWARVRV
jgi:iron complex transport system substrate-binding protein